MSCSLGLLGFHRATEETPNLAALEEEEQEEEEEAAAAREEDPESGLVQARHRPRSHSALRHPVTLPRRLRADCPRVGAFLSFFIFFSPNPLSPVWLHW